jgi:hypothetical protein
MIMFGLQSNCRRYWGEEAHNEETVGSTHKTQWYANAMTKQSGLSQKCPAVEFVRCRTPKGSDLGN